MNQYDLLKHSFVPSHIESYVKEKIETNQIDILLNSLDGWGPNISKFVIAIGKYADMLTIEYCINQNLNIDQLLIGACTDINVDKITQLINLGANINYKNGKCLIKAMKQKNQPIINLLIDCGIVFTSKILGLVIWYNHIDIVRNFINNGKTIESHEMTRALMCFKYDILQLFIDNGSDVDLLCKLYFGIVSDGDCVLDSEMLKFLQKNGADFNLVVSQL